MTNASQCEESPEEANWVNGEIPSILATYCKKEGARLIHLSTDAVMDINKSLKCESDNPKPSDTYGMSKLAGETALMEMQCNYLICRVNFFGLSNKKQSLLDFFVKNIINKRECYGYTNVLFNPISVDNLVKTLWKLEELRIRGLIHITGDDVISKYEFGKEVEAIISGENNFVIPHELSIKEARNIKDLSLCSCKLRNVIQTPFKDWKTELKKQLKGIGDSYEDRN